MDNNISVKKFIKMINSGSHTIFRNLQRKIKKIGEESGKNFRLITSNNNEVLFEDIDENIYYNGKLYKSNDNILEIKDIVKLNIYDEDRSGTLNESYKELVNALSKDDMKLANKSFNKLKALRFRDKIVPDHGNIVCKDDELYKIVIKNDESIESMQLAESIHKILSDKIIKDENGNITEVMLSESKLLKEAKKSLNPKSLLYTKIALERERLKKYYLSEDFINLTIKLAQMVNDDKLEQAIVESSGYVYKEQTLTLLTEQELTDLIGYALATKGIFNYKIAKHVCQILYESALQVNRSDLIEFWNTNNKILNEEKISLLVKSLMNKNIDAYYTLIEDITSPDATVNAMTLFVNSLANLFNSTKVSDAVGGTNIDEIRTELNRINDELQKDDEISDATIVKINDIFSMISPDLMNAFKDITSFDEQEQQAPEQEQSGETQATEIPVSSELGGGGLEGLGGGTSSLNQTGGGLEGIETPPEEEETPEIGGLPKPNEEEEKAKKESIERLQSVLEDIKKETYLGNLEEDIHKLIEESIELGPSGLELLNEFTDIRRQIINENDYDVVINDDDLDITDITEI